jgi:hypothetical protein
LELSIERRRRGQSRRIDYDESGLEGGTVSIAEGFSGFRKKEAQNG